MSISEDFTTIPGPPLSTHSSFENKESSSLIDISSAERENQLLQRLSPFFEVRNTSYGGRGCFASNDISKNTCLLQVNLPLGSTVVRPFRKEVCTWCFRYDDGRSMKTRALNKIFFCTEICRSEYTKYDFDDTLSATMCAAEELFLKCVGEICDDEIPADKNEESLIIDEKWKSVLEWEERFFRMKPSKRPAHYPTITIEDYTDVKYIISTLHSMIRHRAKEQRLKSDTTYNCRTSKYLGEMSFEEAMNFEMEAFEILQSSEAEKMKRYPYLSTSYTNIYKFVRLVCPESWLPIVTPRNIRDIIGRNLTNSFGIWSPVTQEDEDREYFGYAMYPLASFFNHSCASNVKKVRAGASFKFIASEDILAGDELCISYGIRGDETVSQRREILREWFFDCGCTKCKSEEELTKPNFILV